MGTNRPAWATPLQGERCEQALVCPCGQDLDCCTHEHCPLRGITLYVVPLSAVA
jgi:hypothetical protein